MAGETVFAVEDEEHILELIRYNLAREGFAVRGFPSAEAMLSAARAEGVPRAAVLDVMLPGMDGFDACRALRSLEGGAGVAVIMLTAKGAEGDIVGGLENGADDYMVKPFSPRELVARIRAQLRKRRDPQEDLLDGDAGVVEAAGIRVDPARVSVTVDGRSVKLTASEFKALYFLMTHPDRVYSRAQIVEAVHGENYPVTDRSVDVLFVGLRKKLGPVGSRIDTVRGMGYTFRKDD